MFPELNWPDFQPMRSDGQLQEILTSIEQSGLYFKENFIDPQVTDGWGRFVESQNTGDTFNLASIGNKERPTRNIDIRSDTIQWIDEFSGPLAPVGSWLVSLSLELKNYFHLPVNGIESHFSVYPPGARYQRHIDNSTGSHSRFFTFIFYLNSNWKKGDGGELVIYEPDEPSLKRHCIEPKSGTFVLFRSDLFYHEVLVSHAARYTLTGWLRRHEGL